VILGAAGHTKCLGKVGGLCVGDDAADDHREQQTVNADRFDVVVLRQHPGVIVIRKYARSKMAGATNKSDDGGLAVVFKVVFERMPAATCSRNCSASSVPTGSSTHTGSPNHFELRQRLLRPSGRGRGAVGEPLQFRHDRLGQYPTGSGQQGHDRVMQWLVNSQGHQGTGIREPDRPDSIFETWSLRRPTSSPNWVPVRPRAARASAMRPPIPVAAKLSTLPQGCEHRNYPVDEPIKSCADSAGCRYDDDAGQSSDSSVNNPHYTAVAVGW
jgi:hypothetical protein